MVRDLLPKPRRLLSAVVAVGTIGKSFLSSKMSEILYINEETVDRLLNWDTAFEAMQVVMESVTKKRVDQSPRTLTRCARADSLLLTMPGYLDNEHFGALGCKLVTVAPNNARLQRPLPILSANIMLFDEETGALKAVIAGTQITKWRTAIASAVATKFLTPSKPFGTLAILGAGVQGEAHAKIFDHFFKLKEVRIWNRTKSRAEKLVEHLNDARGTRKFTIFDTAEGCVKDADVVVTATFAKEPILRLEWLKEGVHINAVGVGENHHSELAESIYLSENTNVYIDHWSGAEVELAGLRKLGVAFRGEVGGLISGDLTAPPPNRLTVFQSLGMAVEDCATARIVYDRYKKQSENR